MFDSHSKTASCLPSEGHKSPCHIHTEGVSLSQLWPILLFIQVVCGTDVQEESKQYMVFPEDFSQKRCDLRSSVCWQKKRHGDIKAIFRISSHMLCLSYEERMAGHFWEIQCPI
ncbi:hypothetical protein TNCV_5069541 [Trichonephila clavipes]|nr:hypothetical protein TNCV_5069541 [Trichonephila clavipes]